LAYGSVLDLQPLIDLRARYLTAAADVASAQAAVDAAGITGNIKDRNAFDFISAHQRRIYMAELARCGVSAAISLAAVYRSAISHRVCNTVG
jgi:hypothetical protein